MRVSDFSSSVYAIKEENSRIKARRDGKDIAVSSDLIDSFVLNSGGRSVEDFLMDIHEDIKKLLSMKDSHWKHLVIRHDQVPQTIIISAFRKVEYSSKTNKFSSSRVLVFVDIIASYKYFKLNDIESKLMEKYLFNVRTLI